MTGCLDIGSTFQSALNSAETHSLPYEVLTGREVNRRYPGYHVPEEWRALLQPGGGILEPEKCIQAYCSLAQRQGARLLYGERVRGWRPLTHGVEVVTESEERYLGGQLVLAAGPWMRQLVPQLQEVCVPERQVVGWFEVDDPRCFHPSRFPVFVMEDEEGHGYYGFPQFGTQEGFKIGVYHHLRQPVMDPDVVDRDLRQADCEVLRQPVRRFFPRADGRMKLYSTCLFTNTPDGHFIVDRHPLYPQVVLCSACSGHGFKMSSALGQVIASWVSGRELPGDIQEAMALHSLGTDRFGSRLRWH